MAKVKALNQKTLSLQMQELVNEYVDEVIKYAEAVLNTHDVSVSNFFLSIQTFFDSFVDESVNRDDVPFLRDTESEIGDTCVLALEVRDEGHALYPASPLLPVLDQRADEYVLVSTSAFADFEDETYLLNIVSNAFVLPWSSAFVNQAKAFESSLASTTYSFLQKIRYKAGLVKEEATLALDEENEVLVQKRVDSILDLCKDLHASVRIEALDLHAYVKRGMQEVLEEWKVKSQEFLDLVYSPRLQIGETLVEKLETSTTALETAFNNLS